MTNTLQLNLKRIGSNIMIHRALAVMLNIAVLITSSPINLLPAYLWFGFIPLSCMITYKFLQGSDNRPYIIYDYEVIYNRLKMMTDLKLKTMQYLKDSDPHFYY